MTITIAPEPPRQPEVIRLLEMSDAYVASLYPAESNHLVDVSTLEKPSVRFLVARQNGEIVGCCALATSGNGASEIKRMFVDPAARGLRVGKLLLEAVIRSARDLGVDVIRLETGTHQPEAISLYHSAGFIDIPPFEPYRPDPLSLFMEKRLS